MEESREVKKLSNKKYNDLVQSLYKEEHDSSGGVWIVCLPIPDKDEYIPCVKSYWGKYESPSRKRQYDISLAKYHCIEEIKKWLSSVGIFGE